MISNRYSRVIKEQSIQYWRDCIAEYPLTEVYIDTYHLGRVRSDNQDVLDVLCPDCGQVCHVKHVEMHRTLPLCKSRQACIQASKEGYINLNRAGVYVAVNASWSEPFLKRVDSRVERQSIFPEFWVLAWWLELVKPLLQTPSSRLSCDVVDVLQQISWAYTEGRREDLDRIIGILELSRESQ